MPHVYVDLWLWSVEQAAYLRISKTANRCIIPCISADDELACLSNQEIKETNALEQNGSALNSQRYSTPAVECHIPIATVSLAGNHKGNGVLLRSVQRVTTSRKRKVCYLTKQLFSFSSCWKVPGWRQSNKRLKLTLRLYFNWFEFRLKICCDCVLLNAYCWDLLFLKELTDVKLLGSSYLTVPLPNDSYYQSCICWFVWYQMWKRPWSYKEKQGDLLIGDVWQPFEAARIHLTVRKRQIYW